MSVRMFIDTAEAPDSPARQSSELAPASIDRLPRSLCDTRVAHNWSCFVEDIPEYKPYVYTSKPPTPHRRKPGSPIRNLQIQWRRSGTRSPAGSCEKQRPSKLRTKRKAPKMKDAISAPLSMRFMANGKTVQQSEGFKAKGNTVQLSEGLLTADIAPIAPNDAASATKARPVKLRKRPTVRFLAAASHDPLAIVSIRGKSYTSWRRTMVSNVKEQHLTRRVSVQSKSSTSTDQKTLLGKKTGRKRSERQTKRTCNGLARAWKRIRAAMCCGSRNP